MVGHHHAADEEEGVHHQAAVEERLVEQSPHVGSEVNGVPGVRLNVDQAADHQRADMGEDDHQRGPGADAVQEVELLMRTFAFVFCCFCVGDSNQRSGVGDRRKAVKELAEQTILIIIII